MPAVKPFKYIVEHMEEGLDKWSELEYLNISQRVGKGNLILSHLHPNFIASAPESLKEGSVVLSEHAVLDLPGVDPSKVLLLDPASPTPLAPSDGDEGGFEYLLFGGILGDHPPRDRTGELRRLGFATRHLGPVQMTTDTAVMVAQQVIENHVPLDALSYVDMPDIPLGPKESVQMPFRYLVNAKGEPIFPNGLLDLIRESNDESLI